MLVVGADECRILVDSARRQELRQEVEPRIRDRALEMASEIERLVMVYLTPRSRHVRTKHRTVTHPHQRQCNLLKVFRTSMGDGMEDRVAKHIRVRTQIKSEIRELPRAVHVRVSASWGLLRSKPAS